MDPWLTPLITLLAATVGGFASYFGSRHSKGVDQKIAKDRIEFDHRQKRIEYKMQVFSEYISLMHQFSDITEKRWTMARSPNEWKLDLKQIVARLDKSPAMLFLKDDEVKVLNAYNSKVFNLARTYLDKLDFDSTDLVKLAREIIPEVSAAGVDLETDEAVEMVTEKVTELFADRLWPEFEKAQDAAEKSENDVKEILRKNLQADLAA